MVNRSKKLTGPFFIQLRNRFREIAGKDNRIDRQEFHESMLIGNDAITDRIFDIFDKDHNDYLDSEEFLSGFQSLVNGSEEELIRFAFDIHGPFFLYWPSWSFRDHVNHPTINQYTCLNENYAKKDSLPSNDGGPDEQCDRPESTNADSAFPSG